MQPYVDESDSAVITRLDEIDAGRLTRMLAAAGALRSGRARALTVHPLGATNASMARLHIQYEPNAAGALPASLVLKLSGAGGLGFGISEVHYYGRDYIDLPDAPIPRAYHVAHSSRTGRYHILMEDLSERFQPNWEVAPTQAYGEAVAEALATLHARYWTPEQRDGIGATVPGKAEIDEYMAHIRPGVEPMLDASRGEIPAEWADPIRAAARHHPHLLLARTKSPTGFTVVHGDVNPGNVLSPMAGSKPVYLIDRQPFPWSLTTWLGVADVAYLMVHWWDTDLRRQFELPVLRAYHHALIERGVDDYSWDELMLDYRLTAVQSLYVAATWCGDPNARVAMKWVWLPQLRKAMTAILDLGCMEMW